MGVWANVPIALPKCPECPKGLDFPTVYPCS